MSIQEFTATDGNKWVAVCDNTDKVIYYGLLESGRSIATGQPFLLIFNTKEELNLFLEQRNVSY